MKKQICIKCLWNDNCDYSGGSKCKDFAPLNDTYEIYEYLKDLQMRNGQYQFYINEFE